MTIKISYLTIDDAPSPLFVQKLDALVKRDIPAVFFCQGNYLEKLPELAVEAIRRGFVVANHAYDHAHFSDLSLEACLEQIRYTDDLIKQVYQTAGVARPASYFRFPYGDKGDLLSGRIGEECTSEGGARKSALQDALRRLGYTPPGFVNITYEYYRHARLHEDVDWYWTYDVMEWTVPHEKPMFGIDSLEKVLARMDEDVPEGRRGLNDPRSEEIILTHDHEQTSEMFPQILDRLLEKGISFAKPVV